MLITFLRSSSLNTFTMCQQQYFLDYILGIKSEPNKKTVIGTIVHRVLEIIGSTKLHNQNNTEYKIPEYKTPITLDILNEQLIIELCIRVYYSFAEKYSQFDWEPNDLEICKQAVHNVLNDKEFNPLTLNISSIEKNFEISLKKPWAKFRYEESETPAGIGELEGYLTLKGTIDLIFQDEKGLHVVDWKTGRRFDWNKKTVKDYDALLNDKQLLFYYYALNLLFPDIENLLFTIYYINDGGPYTIPFSKKDLIKAEGLIKTAFNEIKGVLEPSLHRSWHCEKFCYFGKHNLKRKKVKSYEDSMCKQLNMETKETSMQHVIAQRMVNNFDLNTYTRGE